MFSQNFLAGPGVGLIFDPVSNALIGVSKTFTENTFGFTITAEEIRGGPGNMLFGKYYHDAGLTVSVTDCMFDLKYIGFITGTNPMQGGIVLKEESLSVGVGGNSVTVSETPVAFNGSMIGWYRKPSETEWNIGTISGTTMTIPSAKQNDTYCVKYFYQNLNAKSITINAQYVPKTVHLVIINDLFPANIQGTSISSSSPKAGRLITDIPNFQFEGSGDLTLAAASAATVPLTGSALTVSSSDTCEDESYYATMTEEIYGAVWQDNVVAIAVENGDVTLAQSGSETLVVRAVFGDNTPAQRMPNSAFTFAVEANPASTATGTTVGQNTGVINAGNTDGQCVVSVNLTGYTDKVEPAYVLVNVTG